MIVENITVSYPDFGNIDLKEGYVAHKNWYKKSETQTKKFWANNVKDDWNILDIGANVGMYSVLFSKLAKNGSIICFEPTPTADILEKNLKHIDANNCTVVRSAIGNKVGNFKDKVQMIWKRQILDQNFDFTTVDHFCKTNNFIPDAIKIDIDGFDPEALYGAKEILVENDVLVIAELNPEALSLRGHRPQDAVDFMKSIGYSLESIMDGENYLFTKEIK